MYDDVMRHEIPTTPFMIETGCKLRDISFLSRLLLLYLVDTIISVSHFILSKYKPQYHHQLQPFWLFFRFKTDHVRHP